MATVTLQGNPINTNGDLPAVGSTIPEIALVKTDLSELNNAELSGKRVVFNIFPSVDTPTCAQSVRTFNEKASGLENTVVLCISQDLPFAQARFCGGEGLDNVVNASGFRSSFKEDFGLAFVDGPLLGLSARAVVITDKEGIVLYSELVSEVADEPNYEAALAALA